MTTDSVNSELVGAVAALWRRGHTPGNLFTLPVFVRLREVCQRLYPSAGSRDAVNAALSQAVYTLGFRWSEASPARFAIAPDIAAARIDGAFRQTQARLVHLCPLDLADRDIPKLRFGPCRIRSFTAKELDDLFDPDGLARARGEWRFESQRFCQFSWLVVEEVVAIKNHSGTRVLPEFFIDAHEDFGRIEPHRRRFPSAVEDALFATLLTPWEDIIHCSEYEWRPFRTPWAHTLTDDLFAQPATLPHADTLSWERDYHDNDYGETIEREIPLRGLSLNDDAGSQTAYLNSEAWDELREAYDSALFSGPIRHFVIRAFTSDGIDEFLAHITAIEAALGMPIDHAGKSRLKRANNDNPAATARVAARISALLADPAAGKRYISLFDERSHFLHGRSMSDITGQSRLEARRLARRCVCALIRAAIKAPRPADRDAFLSDLLQQGWSLTK